MAVEKVALKTILIISLLNSVLSSNFEGLVVDGKRAKIEDFPHATYLYIECFIGFFTRYGCGSSIINQVVLLTAGHCFEKCQKGTYITAFVGSEIAGYGTAYIAATYKMHEDYKPYTNDIALVRLRKYIVFEKNVRRVALMRNRPPKKYARVAGWGYTSEDDSDHTSPYLMQTKQKVRGRFHCMDYLDLNDINEGFICGGSRKAKSYVSKGDSGSALLVGKYIQIGIVAHKTLSKSISVAMYTDVAYHYDWIQENSEKLACQVFHFPTTEPNYSY